MDPEIREQVEMALASLGPLPVVVTVRDGTAYLAGTVVTERQRQHAESLARDVANVRSVVNQIRVEPAGLDDAHLSPIETAPFDEAWPDSTAGTADEIEAVEDGEPYIPPTDPVVAPAGRDRFQEIEVVGGFATSSMEAPFEGDDHGRHAQDDGSLLEDGATALHRDASTIDLPLHVRVRSGIVHLRGRVPSLEDVELIEEVVSRIPGIVEVVDHLDVEGI